MNITASESYPARLSIDFPDRQLDRVSTLLRLIYAIPILIILSLIGGTAFGGGADSYGDKDRKEEVSTADTSDRNEGARIAFDKRFDGQRRGAGAGAIGGGLLVLPVVLMILFRQKYPRWWFDFNLELTRFSTRVVSYLALMSDRYPSTDEQQSIHLDVDFPDVKNELNRWLPLVKWLLAIPHYIVLFFLVIGAIVAVVIGWFAILFTGRYPRGLFDFVEGVQRWGLRVGAYAFLLVTDRYPPFSLA